MADAPADVRHQFVRFAAIGTVAFLVDTAALYFARDALGLGLYLGRVFSFLVAVTFTWALNRRFTFPAAREAAIGPQWLQFVMANGVGALINYATYATLVACVAVVHAWPVLGIAAGSLAGLAFNFAASRRWVFRRSSA